MDDTCSHNPAFKKANCVECMAEGPVVPLTKPKQRAAQWIRARFDGNCADCETRVHEGEEIGLVEGVGWCCSGCAE